jgi:hypothetical protein
MKVSQKPIRGMLPIMLHKVLLLHQNALLPWRKPLMNTSF